jgi:acetyl-CoA decarbonylase/synthase complex subunit gamma
VKGIPVVSSELDRADVHANWRARWGIGRMSYRIEPGLYAIGSPDASSPVLVTANYGLTFARLRSTLPGFSAWILVVDTNGINVWCAAGKGTFCAEEVARQAAAAKLSEIVTHRTLILPQLSAPGVSALEVKRLSGFRAVFGPTRAEDIAAYVSAGMVATPEMRRVTFPFADRISLTPLEIVGGWKYLLGASLLLFMLSGLGHGGYSGARIAGLGLPSVGLLVLAYLAGTVVTPALLPWVPGRAFSTKGAVVGGALALAVVAHILHRGGPMCTWPTIAAWLLLIPTASSVLALLFTGSSTYTSLSGVVREMGLAVPLQIAGGAFGLVLWLAGVVGA